MIDILETATLNYPDIISYGEDAFFLEPIVYKLASVLFDSLNTLPISTDGKISASKQLSNIKAITNKASIVNPQQNNTGSPFTYIQSETISRVIYTLNTTSQGSNVNIQNLLNT